MQQLMRIARLAGASLVLTMASACTSSEPSEAPTNPATDSYATSLGINIAEFTRKTDDVYFKDLTVGTGALVESGKTIRVTYTGYLPNGSQFETNSGGTPYSTTIGIGQVIKGWDDGIVGMHVGGKRRLLIGSRAGYGASGNGKIPPNSTLIFDVEVVSMQ